LEETVKFDLPAFRTSQVAEQVVGTHLCPAAVAVHVRPHVPGNASRWTARAPSPKVLAEVNPSAEAATRAAQHEACPETKTSLAEDLGNRVPTTGPIRGKEARRIQSLGGVLVRMRR
jgi:hypothetical protein